MFFERSIHEVQAVVVDDTYRKSLWFQENNVSSQPNPARGGIYDPVDKNRITYCANPQEIISKIKSLNPDYVCVGNGSDQTGRHLKKAFGSKMLFSEYGWLPWNNHFYISRNGTGFDSELTKLTDISSQAINYEEINSFKDSFPGGVECNYENFVYVPLQVDRRDFKFNFTRFKRNEDFISHICDVIPSNFNILVKNHPLNKKPTQLRNFKRVIDISKSNIDKSDIYSRMSAMFCINSTSILEALAYGKKVFAYGDDIFQNKGIVHSKIESSSHIALELNNDHDPTNGLKFVSLLFNRQVNRSRCFNNDREYINNHFWSKSL
jgi:hypothetical protein